MSEPTAPVPAPSDNEMNVLAARLRELLLQDRGERVAPDVPAPPPRKPREPIISPAIRASIAHTCALWPLFAVNALLLWVMLVLPESASYALYLERVVRILQLSALALLFDVWLHPGQHPSTLDGPAQGARQYQRIYTVGIFVIAGCLTP